MVSETGWNILQKSKNPVVWVFVAENVEDEALFGEERFAISVNPIVRCQTARLHCLDSKLCSPSSPLNIPETWHKQKKKCGLTTNLTCSQKSVKPLT